MCNKIISFPAAERAESIFTPSPLDLEPVVLSIDEFIQLVAARQAAPVPAADAAKPVYEVTTRPGYMGAVAWDGSNAHRNLFGANLSKAIREALKADGIKGVSVRVQTYSGGQSIDITIKTAAADFLSLDEYIAATSIFGNDFVKCGWILDTDQERNVDPMEVNGWDDEKRQRVHAALAARELEQMSQHEPSLNEYHLDDYKMFAPAFLAKLHRIKQIVDSFNYSDSNSMVDYFDRGFYESYYLKPSGK